MEAIRSRKGLSSRYILSAATAFILLAVLAQPASAGAAKKLVFTQNPPASVTAGVAFPVTVQTQDAQGNPAVVDPPPTITLALQSSNTCAPSGHTLYVTATSVSGADTNFTLKVVPAGVNCKLGASADKLNPGNSNSFNVTGFACPVGAGGGSCTDDPNGKGATSQNTTTTTATLDSCTAAAGSSFLSVDDDNQVFDGPCNGSCESVVFVAWDCLPDPNSAVLIIITVDKSQLPKPPSPDKGAVHIDWYKEGFGLVPDCITRGVLDGPVCVSRQYSNSGDRITEILESPIDGKYAR